MPDKPVQEVTVSPALLKFLVEQQRTFNIAKSQLDAALALVFEVTAESSGIPAEQLATEFQFTGNKFIAIPKEGKSA